jgi:predicted metal-binding protein
MSLGYKTILATLAPATLFATVASAAPVLVVNNFGYEAGGWRVDRHPRLLADLTGDDRADIVGFGNAGVYVSLNNGNGTFQPPAFVVDTFGYEVGGWRIGRHPRMLAELNGDDAADIVGFGNSGVYVALNEGNGTFEEPAFVLATFGYQAGGWRVERHPRMLGDLTGDGADDIVGFGNAGVYVALNDGDGTFEQPLLALTTFGYEAGGWRVGRHPRMLAELNGDDAADIIGFGNAGAYVSINDGDGTFQEPFLAVSTFGYEAGGWRVERHPRMMADVDGDGTDDIVGFGNAGVYVSLNNGDGTFQAPFLAVSNYGYQAGGWRVTQHPRMMAELNGDDRADIVGFGNAGVYVSLSTGGGRFQPPRLAVGNFGYQAGGWRVTRHPRMLADVTGDGLDDIVGFGNAGVYVDINQGNGTFQ